MKSLTGLAALARLPNARVIVVHGYASGDVAERAFPKNPVLSAVGDAIETDWQPLFGRDVLILAMPGSLTWADDAHRCLLAGARQVWRVSTVELEKTDTLPALYHRLNGALVDWVRTRIVRDHQLPNLVPEAPSVAPPAMAPGEFLAAKRAFEDAVPLSEPEPAPDDVLRGTPPAAEHDDPGPSDDELPEGVTSDDFRAYLPDHRYIFIPTGVMWPKESITSVCRDRRRAWRWLDRNRPIHQLTWDPAKPQIVPDALVDDGGWIRKPGCTVFNRYRPPGPRTGDPSAAGPWFEHVTQVYGEDAKHVLAWLAHRVQHPGIKINHALLLGGAPGIGKDTILEPVKHAVGAWNFAEVSPAQLIGRFNGFIQSVILRINEIRDLGDIDRYGFYEHTKTYTASPPDVLRVDEKHLRAFSVINVTGVVITTNHKTDGLYLPADDRRHYVAWSEKTAEAFPEAYWKRLYGWYETGGMAHVAAYLASYPLADWNAKAPPPKTQAFWDIVEANRAPEDAEIADSLDVTGKEWPEAITIGDVVRYADDKLRDWMTDRRNSRQIPHRLEAAGYTAVRNQTTADGLWRIEGKRTTVYAKKNLSIRDRHIAASKRAASSNLALN